MCAYREANAGDTLAQDLRNLSSPHPLPLLANPWVGFYDPICNFRKNAVLSVMGFVCCPHTVTGALVTGGIPVSVNSPSRFKANSAPSLLNLQKL